MLSKGGLARNLESEDADCILGPGNVRVKWWLLIEKVVWFFSVFAEEPVGGRFG